MNRTQKTKRLFLVCALILAQSNLFAGRNVDATINYQVVDLRGRPMPDITVKTTFRYMSMKPYGRRHRVLEGTTDSRGRLTQQGETYGRLDYEISGPDLYDTSCHLYSKVATLNQKVTVRPKVNPIPMFALKGVEKLIPIQGQPVGFDLLKADWMPPHGQGEVADLVVVAQSQWGPLKDYEQTYWSTLEVNFPGRGNGILFSPNRTEQFQSVLRSDYAAPLAGYLPNVVFEDTELYEKKTAYKYADVQYFRIRSERGLNGKAGGHYGKIYDNLIEMTEKGPVLVLSYLFINPTEGSRNVEFDPNQNLAPGYQPVVPAAAFKVDLP